NVAPGQHSLRIVAQGRQTVTREITVTAGQTTAIEIPELAVVAQVGHVSVRSQTPNVSVFVDGRNMGPSPYTRDDMPAGSYNITLRAQGFDDRTETCTVSTTQGCDVNLPLTRTVGRASLHVELGRPVAGATVMIDNNAIGEIGAGRDIPNVTADTHEIRVRAEGYNDYVESVTFQENEQHRTLVTLRRSQRGPTGAELATRRAAISTWGASPLSRGDRSLDVFVAIGAYPAQIRGMIGLLGFGIAGVDAGFAVRTMGRLWELELRGRFGVRLLDGLISLGAEIAPFAGIGTEGEANYGVRGFALASIHSLAPTEDNDSDDPNERSNRLGSFAMSVGFGFEAMSDGLNGLVRRWGNLSTSPSNFAACDPVTTTTPPVTNPCGIQTAPVTAMQPNQLVTVGSQVVVRPLFRVMIEIGLSRHVNIFAGIERVIADQANIQSQRAYYEQFWNFIGGQGRNDLLTYVNAGLTYKF
ncbi:MAG: PEGA domain-containing protein, partial [Deltaproteobacteria bacterium]